MRQCRKYLKLLEKTVGLCGLNVPTKVNQHNYTDSANISEGDITEHAYRCCCWLTNEPQQNENLLIKPYKVKKIPFRSEILTTLMLKNTI